VATVAPQVIIRAQPNITIDMPMRMPVRFTPYVATTAAALFPGLFAGIIRANATTPNP
jgi:hypothetical protein